MKNPNLKGKGFAIAGIFIGIALLETMVFILISIGDTLF
jgi:hypothetical protein